jgi:hypothetical protein
MSVLGKRAGFPVARMGEAAGGAPRRLPVSPPLLGGRAGRDFAVDPIWGILFRLP